MNQLHHRVVWVGRQASCPFLAAANDYLTRLQRYSRAELVRVRPSGQQAEGRALLAQRGQFQCLISLSVTGQPITTDALIAYFRASVPRQSFCYLIGGADGLPDDVINSSHASWSLSPLTMPHRAALAVWLEQLFRVHTVLAGQTYHR